LFYPIDIIGGAEGDRTSDLVTASLIKAPFAEFDKDLSGLIFLVIPKA